MGEQRKWLVSSFVLRLLHSLFEMYDVVSQFSFVPKRTESLRKVVQKASQKVRIYRLTRTIGGVMVILCANLSQLVSPQW